MTINLRKATKDEIKKALESGTLKPSTSNLSNIIGKVPLASWPPSALSELRKGLASTSAGNYKYDAIASIVIDELNRRRHLEETRNTEKKFNLSLSVAILFPTISLGLTYYLSTLEGRQDQNWQDQQEIKLEKLVKQNIEMIAIQEAFIKNQEKVLKRLSQNQNTLNKIHQAIKRKNQNTPLRNKKSK